MRRELRRGGRPVEIGSTAFDVLLAMVRNPGRPVSHAELIATVWARRAVDTSNLRVQVAAVRAVLGGDTFVRTIPGKGYLFAADVTRGTVPGSAAPAVKHSLEVPFIGRRPELDDLRAVLDANRLVTVIGPGGIGKTRLVLRLAELLAPEFLDGVCTVDLAPIAASDEVADTVATKLGAGAGTLAGVAAVIAALRSAAVLLVLDNAEHLLDGVRPLLCAILTECRHVPVLVTSRVPLGIPGEAVFTLAPMRVPTEEDTPTAQEALDYDSVRLFCERARSLLPCFSLEEVGPAAIAEICRRLGGVALAIEMVAARLQVMSVGQLLTLLRHGVELMAPRAADTEPRGQTLRTMFDWSWAQLQPEERRLLQHMALFSGSASLGGLVAMAEAEECPAWAVLDQLVAVVRASLALTQGKEDEPRYALLETTRQYVLGRLPVGALARLRRAHALHIACWFERAEAEWPTEQSAVWLARYEPDADNLRSALHWAFAAGGDEGIGMRLVAASYPLWWELPTLPLREMRRWFDLAIARIGADMHPALEARLWLGHSWRDVVQGDLVTLPSAERAAEIFGALGDAVGRGAALWRAGSATLRRGRLDAANARLAEAEALLRVGPPTKWLALCLIRRGDVENLSGDREAAVKRYREAIAMCHASGHWYGLMLGASNMADSLFELGRADEAIALASNVASLLSPAQRLPLTSIQVTHLAALGRYDEAHGHIRDIVVGAGAAGLETVLGRMLEMLALLAIEAGEAAAAAHMTGCAMRIYGTERERFGGRAVVFTRLTEALTRALPEAHRALLTAEGATWSDSTAIDKASSFLDTGAWSGHRSPHRVA